MTKLCAIPKCNTGYRLSNVKRSLFRVPIDVKRYEKWLAVIPGLKQSQFVCEKHFERQFILRHWKKYDANGRFIIQVPYMKPKLESAVPSIFEDDEEIQQPLSHTITDELMNEVLKTLPLPREVSDLNVMDCSVKDETDDASLRNADVLGQGSLIKTETSTHDLANEVAVMPQESVQPEIVAWNESVGFEVLLISEVAAVVANSHECASASGPVSSIKVATSKEDVGQSFILIPKSWIVQKK